MAAGYAGYYPGMITKEANIWNAFLAQNPGVYQNPDYNVRVGQGRDPGATYPDFARREAIKNSQLRLDVVTQQAGTWWIFEVKDYARAGSCGQLKQYEILFEEAYPERRPIALGLVTNAPTLGLQALCDRLGITLFLVDVPIQFKSPEA